jgi:CubicO group peptidase (beta-lactamase class C family)
MRDDIREAEKLLDEIESKKAKEQVGMIADVFSHLWDSSAFAGLFFATAVILRHHSPRLRYWMYARTIMSLSLSMALTLPAVSKSSTAGIQSQLDAILRRHFEAGDFSGSVLVARGEKIVYERSYGPANREWGISNNAHTKFEIGSMTKQFTALLVLDFIRSGAGFIEGPQSRKRYDVQEFVLEHCSGNLEFEPGSKFSYSNSGYFLLCAILEELSKKPYEQLLSERIFQPLGMKESGYAHPETILRNRAAGYERTAAGLRNARYYDMSIPFSAGALYSTTHDLYLWDRALNTERLLPDRLKDLLFTPNLESYGYGWAILVPDPGSPYAGEQIPMHGGAIFGFQSLIQRISKDQELIILLDNSDSPKLLEIALEIRRVLATNP